MNNDPFQLFVILKLTLITQNLFPMLLLPIRFPFLVLTLKHDFCLINYTCLITHSCCLILPKKFVRFFDQFFDIHVILREFMNVVAPHLFIIIIH